MEKLKKQYLLNGPWHYSMITVMKGKLDQKYRQKNEQNLRRNNMVWKGIQKDIEARECREDVEKMVRCNYGWDINITMEQKRKEIIGIGKDMMGFRNEVVKNYRKFVLGELERCPTKNQFLQPIRFSLIPSLGLSSPIQLHPTLWLHTFGNPIIRNKKWLIHNNMITRRQYFSFTRPHLVVTYFQINIILEGEQYCCVVDEADAQSPVLYHRDDRVLEEKVGGVGNNREAEVRREKLSGQPPQYMLGAVMKHIIRGELETQEVTLDELLENKLGCRGSYLTCMKVFDSSPTEFVIEEMQDYLSSVLLLHGLKNCSVGQFFLGYYHPVYLAWEIFHFTEAMLEDAKHSDPALHMEVSRELGKSQDHKYPIRIHHTPDLQISRHVPESPVRPTAKAFDWEGSEGLGSERVSSFIVTTVHRLLSRYTTHELVHMWKELVQEELRHVEGMGKKMMMYLHMKRAHRVYQEQRQLGEVGEERSAQELEELTQAYHNGELILSHDQIIYTCD